MMGTDDGAMDRIMKRLAHLMALADNPGSEHEAAEAVAAIQRLIRKHNISQAQIERAQKGDPDYAMKVIHDYPAAAWRRTLLIHVAATSGCRCVWVRNREFPVSTPHLFGREETLAAVLGMVSYLVAACLRLADEGWWDQPLAIRRATTARRWKNAFRIGCVRRLGERLAESVRAEEAQDTEQEHALVLHDAAMLDASIRRVFPGMKARAGSSGYSDPSGLEAGYLAGDAVSLAKQIGEES